AGIGPKRFFREIKLKDATDKKPGDTVNVELFSEVKFVDVVGVSKGKGFAGVMKRHSFGGQPASRATWRGQCGKPKKGVRMAGHMGVDQVTTRNHPLVKVDAANNLLLIKGALPGAN